MREIQFKHYADGDYQAVCDFLIALNGRDWDHINWNWARFEWMVGHPGFDMDSRAACGLWFCEERIVGAAIYDMYYGEAFCGALPEYGALYPEILAYAWEALRDDAGLGVSICDGKRPEIEAAEKAGFSPAEQTETILLRTLDEFPPAALPEGLQLAQLDPEKDEDALQWLFWQGFDHGEDRAEFERSDRTPARPRPHFDARLNLAAVDESGEPVSCCGLWYDPRIDYAYVEPVCTIPRWRGKGAAKALLFEAMRRARALGAKRAIVISDQAFYKKLGFTFDRRFTFYWKKQEEQA